MGYAILRTQKLKSGQAVRRSLAHAFREQDTPNADPARTPDNTAIGAAGVDEALAKFNARLPYKVRSNAVLAIEYLVTASPEDMHGKSRAEQDAYFGDALEWLKSRHGDENVVCAGIHRDETTPHMYAYVVPIDERGKLNCRAFLGGAGTLNQMQTSFAQEVGQVHGLQRGIEGSKARHTSIQQYYSRANQAFEPLPEVKTAAPKLRPDPEKPGMFAGAEAKAAYQDDFAAWAKEKAAAEAQRQQHMAEVKAQRDAAVSTARRHQAQAREAQALKTEVGQLKQANGGYARKTTELTQKVAELASVVDMLTPDEIAALRARRQQLEVERAAEAEKTRQRAAEAARQASITAEREKRLQGLQKLLQQGGTAHTFGVKAAEALRAAGGDVAAVDWSKVEGAAIREAMAKHGQSAESVIEAINRHSPARANPATHQKVADWVHEKAPQLRLQYEQRHGKGYDSPEPSR